MPDNKENWGRVMLGDCIEVLRGMPPASVDAVITDPPYGLEFMGKEWDRLSGKGRYQKAGVWQDVDGYSPPSYVGGFAAQEWHTGWLSEAFRVLKPGGMLFAFGGTRTFHRLACAIEDVGFELRDTLMWLYGSGFPKAQKLEYEGWEGWKCGGIKPSFEPILWARRPCEGSTSANVLKYGVGAFNADAGRVACDDKAILPAGVISDTQHIYGGGNGLYGDRPRTEDNHPTGRFPPNLLLDSPDDADSAAAMLDEQSGENGASRFFPRFSYTAKACRWEREAGLNREPQKVNDGRNTPIDNAFQRGETLRMNTHPCVKPIRLMRWLIELVTREGDLILDPLAGTGSTGCAAVWCGREFIGIEKEAEYHTIAVARVKWWARQRGKEYDAVQRQWCAESADAPLFGGLI